jgi:hypothetical protein
MKMGVFNEKRRKSVFFLIYVCILRMELTCKIEKIYIIHYNKLTDRKNNIVNYFYGNNIKNYEFRNFFKEKI